MEILLSVLFLIVVAYAAAISYFHFVRNPLPWPDRGGAIFACPDERAQKVMVEILNRHGIKPRFRLDTREVKRALFWDGTIINTSTEEFYQKIGRPAAAKPIVTDMPVGVAHAEAAFLRSAGYEAEVLENVEPDAPPDSLVFLRTTAANNWILVFRKPLTQMGPRPPKWED